MSPRAYALGKRQAAVEQTRSRILAATRALLAESGFTSLEAIARRADVARKTVYYQFGSKLGLLDALITESEQRSDLADRLRVVVQQAESQAALRMYFQEVCRFWASDHAVMRSLHGVAALDPDVERVLRKHDAARRARLDTLIDRLADQGKLRQGHARRHVVDALWMLTSFPTFDHLVSRSDLSIEQAAALLLGLAEGLVDVARPGGAV